MARLALITTDLSTTGFDDPDLVPIETALRDAGHDVELTAWTDASIDWSRFDLALIRCPWDYMDRVEEFSAWLDLVEQHTTLWNPPSFIRWNLDKTYLLELEHVGVPIVPTLIGEASADAAASIAAVGEAGFDEVIVKPTVSAGSKDTGRFAVADPAAQALADHIVSLGKSVIVQPAIPGVAEVGETALMFFGGEFSHAFTKGPLLALGGGLLTGDVYEEQLALTVPTVDELDVAHQVVAAVRSLAPGLDGAAPLYARIDLVATDEGPLLLEAEMFEPSYNVWLADGLVDRYVAAVEALLAERAE